MGGARLRRESGALRVGVGVLLGSMVVASSAAANRPLEPQSVVWLSLADGDAARRQYSLVPRDSPVVLLPLAVRGSDGAWINWDTVQFEFAPLTVDGDPDGELTGAGPGGARIDGFAWTPAVDRELGRTHTARLASGRVTTLAVPPGYSQSLSIYDESTFEFSYMDGTSADFLPSVELTPLFIHSSRYSSVGDRMRNAAGTTRARSNATPARVC